MAVPIMPYQRPREHHRVSKARTTPTSTSSALTLPRNQYVAHTSTAATPATATAAASARTAATFKTTARRGPAHRFIAARPSPDRDGADSPNPTSTSPLHCRRPPEPQPKRRPGSQAPPQVPPCGRAPQPPPASPQRRTPGQTRTSPSLPACAATETPRSAKAR